MNWETGAQGTLVCSTKGLKGKCLKEAECEDATGKSSCLTYSMYAEIHKNDGQLREDPPKS
jgi:hypothetical protein